MNESLEIKIVKGKVSQAGYEDAICTFIKADENRTDSLSDKPLYIVEDMEIADGVYAVTPNVTEALNRSPRKTIGVMNSKGEIILPIINSDIVKITDNYVAVKTTSSMQELETAKSDPTKVQDNALISQSIKNKILEMDQNARFVCDDYYGVYDLYEVKDGSLNRVSDNVSYIATNNETIYAQTNRLEDEVQVVGKKMEEPSVAMPVGALADVTDKPLDNLGNLPEMPEELPGAPELNEEPSEFNIDEMQKELADFANEVETPVEPVQQPEEVTNENYELQNEIKEESYEAPIETPENFERVVENDFEEEKIEQPRTVFNRPEYRDEFEEKIERRPVREYFEERRKEKNDINSLVSAVKAKMEKHEEEITRLQDANAEKERELEDREDEIRKLQNESSKKDYEIEKLQLMLDKKEASLNEIRNELKDKDDMIESLNRKAEKYQETMSTIYDEFSGMLDSGSGRGRGYSKVA